MDFTETVAVSDVNVGMSCMLNAYMKIHMYMRSKSFFDLGPRSLRFRGFNIFKHLLLRNHLANQSQILCRSSVGWGTKVCSYDPGHMTKMTAMPVYGKNF